MSAQLSRCVAVYSRHYVASRINQSPRRRRRRRVYFGPYRNNPDNNGMDQIVTLPSPPPPPARHLFTIARSGGLTLTEGGGKWKGKGKGKRSIAVRKVATPLQELTCHTGSHSVTCHPTQLTFPPLPQPKLVLD